MAAMSCARFWVTLRPVFCLFYWFYILFVLCISVDTVSHVLKKYEDEFFCVTNAKLKLLELMRKGVISDDLVMKIESADEEEARELLFKHLHCHANVAKLREYCRIAISADGYPKMQDLGEKMLRNLPPEGLLRLVGVCIRVCGVSVCLCAYHLSPSIGAGLTCGQASNQAEAQGNTWIWCRV